MKVIKQKELLIFDFEDGKTASYNLNTGETIGKQGRPVKNLCSALTGYNFNDIMNAIENEKYKAFLKFVINRNSALYSRMRHSWNGTLNFGTVLKYANNYKTQEGYFLAGLDVDRYIRTPIQDVPKGLLRLCRDNNFQLDEIAVLAYKNNPNAFTVAFGMELQSISKQSLFSIMKELCYPTQWRATNKLLTDFHYDLRALLKYMDYLITFEGIDDGRVELVREISDYANMMHQISNKFEKYPRYFLSTHKIASRNYERLRREFSESLFQKRITPEYEITYKDYKFFYPKSTQDIKDEAVQQQNCVASYIDRVIDGQCHILFLRKKDEPTKSVVTIEVRNGKIVQAFQKYNTPCTPEQQEAIEYFNKKFYKGE